MEKPSREQMQGLAVLLERLTRQDGTHQSEAIASLCLYRASRPGEAMPVLYRPSLCIIAQGTKEVRLGDEAFRYDPAHYLLTSVDLPVTGQVMEATAKAPYLSLSLNLEPADIQGLTLDKDLPPAPLSSSPRGIAVSRVDTELLDAVLRLVRLLERPRDIPILAPLIIREIQYRLLMGEQEGYLRRMMAANSEVQRIARAIQWLKLHFAEPVRIEEVAREAFMSPSGLYHHFKAVTAMSPLQYQKQLRLQEARRLLLSEGLDAAAAGFRVGYESPSQFSREYRRQFGAPPLQDRTLALSAAASAPSDG
ncbi:MAG: AraC family transcriptional regulator [Cytophagales bacterium]|nr:AraC family transcriptional regulator [Armatimonadota bacterium]